MFVFVSTPTPDLVEVVLLGIMRGSSALARYGRLVFTDESEAATEIRLSELPWWADVVHPSDQGLGCFGGGITHQEAAAAAWVHACVGPWFDPKFSHTSLALRNYQSVPRVVPEGWRFCVYTDPGVFCSRPYNPTKGI